MRKKSEFETFCDNLTEGQVNKVSYVRSQLQDKYGEELDMLLMIKAEANEMDVMQNVSARVSMLALIFSAIGIMRGFIPDMGIEWVEGAINIFYIFMMMLATVLLIYRNNSGSASKWRKYVLIVIDELIEESKCTETQDQKKEIAKKGKGRKGMRKNKKGNKGRM